jgi:hypothetical protein
LSPLGAPRSSRAAARPFQSRRRARSSRAAGPPHPPRWPAARPRSPAIDRADQEAEPHRGGVARAHLLRQLVGSSRERRAERLQAAVVDRAAHALRQRRAVGERDVARSGGQRLQDVCRLCLDARLRRRRAAAAAAEGEQRERAHDAGPSHVAHPRSRSPSRHVLPPRLCKTSP